MKPGPSGTVLSTPPVGGETVRAFVPKPLPPTSSLVVDAALRKEIDQALLALGRLDSLSSLLPYTALSRYTLVRKEAVHSSQIEGSRSSLADFLRFEIEEALGILFDAVRAGPAPLP